MSDFSYWLWFFTAALALNLTPGPDIVYVLGRTLSYGYKIGLASTLGTCSGALLHAFAAALGLSAILTTSTFAFALVQYSGAAYLIYLGIGSLRAREREMTIQTQSNACPSFAQAFRQGILVDLLNPKVAIFFMAFLPQFIRQDGLHPTLQLMYLGALVVLVSFIVEGCAVLAAANTSRYLQQHPRVTLCLEYAVGIVFIALGLRLAWQAW